MQIRISDFIRFSPKQRHTYSYVGKGARVLFGGGRGSGKSWLMLWAAVLAAIQFPGLQIAIIRTNMPELRRSFIRPFLKHVPRQLYRFSQRDNSATFFNGSVIDFIGLESPTDASKLKGPSYGFLCIDEVNTLHTDLIDRITGSLRSTVAKGFVPTMLMTANPGEQSDHYCIKYYVQPDYKLWTEEEFAERDNYIYVHATVYDNPDTVYVQRYVKELKKLPEHLRKQWLDGDWTAFEGQFFEEWDNRYHVVTPFDIPRHWLRYRGMDHGRGSHPSVCLWAAQNPETLDVFIYRELATLGVTSRFIDEVEEYSPAHEEIIATHADTSMWYSSHDHYSSESPAFMFLRAGIPLTRAIKDRITGWRVVKQWLHWSQVGDDPTDPEATGKYMVGADGLLHPQIILPRLRFFDTCTGCIQTLPRLKYTRSRSSQRLGDLDTDQQDDYADALRYLMMGSFGYPMGDDAGPPATVSHEQPHHPAERPPDFPARDATTLDSLHEKGGRIRPKSWASFL